MAQTGLIQEGIDRFESAFRTLEKDVRRLQRRADKRRKDFERRAEKQVKRIQTEIRKNPVVKRADAIRGDATKAFGDGVESVLSGLGVATQSDVHRIDRKLSQLSRKLRELEKQGSSRSSSTQGAA